MEESSAAADSDAMLGVSVYKPASYEALISGKTLCFFPVSLWSSENP
jgi:hypothetical protein